MILSVKVLRFSLPLGRTFKKKNNRLYWDQLVQCNNEATCFNCLRKHRWLQHVAPCYLLKP